MRKAMFVLLAISGQLIALTAFGADAKFTPGFTFEASNMAGSLAGSSPDGKVTLKIDHNVAQLITVATKQPFGKAMDAGESPNNGLARYQFTCWSFSPDGKYVVTGSGYHHPSHFQDPASEDEKPTNAGQVEVWDAATGELVERAGRLYGSIRSVRFSKDGLTIYFQADQFSIDRS
jgi:uncharacterized protein with WD repeat